MFKKILIIGCGLIGSSILRAIKNKKLAKKIFVLEKSFLPLFLKVLEHGPTVFGAWLTAS